MSRKISSLVFSLLAVLSGQSLGAVDYYVAPSGSDKAPGSRAHPFATFRRGLKALKAGDTLILAPGDYAGAGVVKLAGTPEKPIVVRAEIPGTAVIRGDREVKGFRPVSGTHFIYELDRNEAAGGVKERDTLTYYRPVSCFDLLKYDRAVYFHDVKKGKLYVVTSDGRAPGEHFVTVCGGDPREGHGLQLIDKSCYVRFEGLKVTGFDSYVTKWEGRYYSIKSLLLNHSSNIEVDNCRFFLNGCGLTFWECRNCRVENCTAYANHSLAVGSAANIYFTGKTENCVVRNCTAFKSHLSGIRFYSGPFPHCVIDRCAAWGHGMSDLEIKAPDKTAVISESIGVKCAVNTTVRNCITGGNSYRLTPKDDPTSLYWRQPGLKEKMNDNLADFDNWDGRPMSDSALKGGLSHDKKLFFLAPGGSDANSGTTIRAPRKSLKGIPDGATVYLMPGKYGKLTVTQNNILLAGRGRYTKALVGGLEVLGSGVTVRKLNFGKDVSVTGANVKIENCSFAGDAVFTGAKNFTVVHCAFAGSVLRAVKSSGALFSSIVSHPAVVRDSEIFSDNNAYPENVPAGEGRSMVCRALFRAPEKGDFTLKNAEAFAGRALDAFPIGPYNRIPGVSGKGILYARVHRTTPGSAEIEWHLPTGRESCSIRLSGGKEKRPLAVHGKVFRTVTLTGLKPGTSYTCRISSVDIPEERFLNVELTSADRSKFNSAVELEFTTPVKRKPPKEYFVSVKGSDEAPGTEEAPFRTLEHALDRVSPGETVTLRGGRYSESVIFRVSGLTLRGMHGEEVWLDGRRQLLNFISISNKRNIVIDDLRMTGLTTTKGEYISAVNSSGIRISRVFFDGRWANGYTPAFLYAYLCKNVLIENCVTMNAFRGLHFIQTDGVRVRNCVLSMNSLNQLHFNSFPDTFRADIENNIICDLIPMKLRNALIHAEHTHPNLKIENNCFYTRTDVLRRNFVGTWFGPGSGFHPLAHYRAAHPGKETNIFKDPQIPGLKLHKPPFDPRTAQKEYRATPDGKSWEKLDFKDFFPADPEIRRRGMGLREAELR